MCVLLVITDFLRLWCCMHLWCCPEVWGQAQAFLWIFGSKKSCEQVSYCFSHSWVLRWQLSPALCQHNCKTSGRHSLYEVYNPQVAWKVPLDYKLSIRGMRWAFLCWRFNRVNNLYLGEIFPISMSPSSVSFCCIKANLNETAGKPSEKKGVEDLVLSPSHVALKKSKFVLTGGCGRGRGKSSISPGVREVTLGMNCSFPLQFQILANFSQASLRLKDVVLDFSS